MKLKKLQKNLLNQITKVLFENKMKNEIIFLEEMNILIQ